MWLQVPEAIKEVLWEGSLEAATIADEEMASRAWADQGQQVDIDAAKRDLPVVSVGQPEVWPLEELYPPDKVPTSLKTKMKEFDFYMVALSCSFRPVRKESRIEWARFSVYLLPDLVSQGQPIAYDLHPLLLTQEIQHNVKVILSPSLKFKEVEVGVGSAEFGLEYKELQPIVSASGVGESVPSWDYEAARGVAVQGSKWMHLLVRAPKGMKPGRAVLDLVADVEVHGFRLPTLFGRGPNDAEAGRTVELWG